MPASHAVSEHPQKTNERQPIQSYDPFRQLELGTQKIEPDGTINNYLYNSSNCLSPLSTLTVASPLKTNAIERDLVLATTGDGGGVMSSRGAADGSSAISLEVQNRGNGTVRIKAGYYNLWVQLTAYDVKTVQWEPNSPYQRLTQRDAGNGYYSFTVDFFSWSRKFLHFLKYIEVPCDGIFLDGMGWG